MFVLPKRKHGLWPSVLNSGPTSCLKQMKKHSTTVLSAMMAGMDDRDDPEDLITLEAMNGLSKVLAKVRVEAIARLICAILNLLPPPPS